MLSKSLPNLLDIIYGGFDVDTSKARGHLRSLWLMTHHVEFSLDLGVARGNSRQLTQKLTLSCEHLPQKSRKASEERPA